MLAACRIDSLEWMYDSEITTLWLKVIIIYFSKML
jgi:hypothetical protein